MGISLLHTCFSLSDDIHKDGRKQTLEAEDPLRLETAGGDEMILVKSGVDPDPLNTRIPRG